MKEIIKTYFENKKDIVVVYLFGSYAKDKANKYSDVDVAVLLDESFPTEKYTDKQIEIAKDLSGLLDKNVDAVVLNRAGSFLKFRVLKEGEIIYESKRRTRDFEACSLIEYFDFLPVKNRIESTLLEKLKQA